MTFVCHAPCHAQGRSNVVASRIAALSAAALLVVSTSSTFHAQAGGPVALTALDVAYSQDFSTLASSGTSSDLPVGWAFAETGSNANTTYTAGNGSANAGDTLQLRTRCRRRSRTRGTAERFTGSFLRRLLRQPDGSDHHECQPCLQRRAMATGHRWPGRSPRLSVQRQRQRHRLRDMVGRRYAGFLVSRRRRDRPAPSMARRPPTARISPAPSPG